ncbi:MAG: sugar transporter, partial [Bacilli bacterium]
KKYPEVMKYTKQIFVHKVCQMVQFQTKPFLVYIFVSLREVALYGNYEIICSKIVFLINGILGSTEAGIGNLIAEKNTEKSLNIFWELLSIRFFIAGFVILNIYMMINSFIVLWLGNQYVLPHIILILILSDLFIHTIGGLVYQFLNGYGLFYDIWMSILSSTLYVIIAIGGGYFLGLQGILWGGVISSFVISSLWKPYFLFTKGFKVSILSYWKEWIKYCGIMAISIALTMYIINDFIFIDSSSSWLNWIYYACLINVLFIPIYFIALYLGSPGMKCFIRRAIHKKA